MSPTPAATSDAAGQRGRWREHHDHRAHRRRHPLPEPPYPLPEPPYPLPEPAYPLPDTVGDDPRFTAGLIFDIADVLTRHGYPRPAGTDWADLGSALFRFIYQENNT